MGKNKEGFIILVLSLGALMGALNMTIFNVAMPMMMVSFDTSVSMIQWLSSGYLLATGIITPAAGYLGDRFGSGRVFCINCCIILAISILGVFSWCIEALIVIRFLFGLTAGLMLPLTMAMLYQAIPASRQTQAVSLWGMANMIGGAAPACISGALLSVTTWHSLLLLNVPLALLSLILGLKHLPRGAAKQKASLDIAGLMMTSGGSLILLIAFSNLSAWGLFSVKFWVLTVLGAGLLVYYVISSFKRQNVLLNLTVFKYSRYSAAFASDAINTVAMYMVTFVMPLFLQNALHLSPLATGAIILPGSLLIIVALPVAGGLNTKLGEKSLALIALMLLILGALPFIGMTPAIPILLIIVAMCIRSVGIGFMNLLTTNTQMSAVPAELSGHASALTNWMRQMVGALVTSIASNIVAFRLIGIDSADTESIALSYTNTTSLLMCVSCILTILIIPVVLKFFQGRQKA